MHNYNLLFACLRNLGIEPNMDTFRERKRMQKIVYVIQHFGIKLGFDFTWYLYGPYSPDLTTAIFDVIERNFQVEERRLSPKEQKILSSISNFLGEDINSTENLELLGSLIYLKDFNENSMVKHKASKQEIISILKERKPHFSDEEIEYQWKRLEAANI
jgi:uncharacterized protein YwgA